MNLFQAGFLDRMDVYPSRYRVAETPHIVNPDAPAYLEVAREAFSA